MTDKEREHIRTLKSLLADFIRDNETADKQYYQEVWDWLDSIPVTSLQQEQPDVDLDGLIENYILQNFGERWDGCVPVSCFELDLMGEHFYKLGLNARKELPDSPDFEAEWKRYTASRKDDMRTNAVTMNVKEVALYFAKWGRKQVLTAKPSEELEEEIHRYFNELEKSDCVSNTRRLAKHFADWQKQQDDELLTIAYFDGVQSGREAERKEMIKEAVEGRYMKTIDGECYVESSIFSPDGFVQVGGKVKLIILKEND